jgi:hypothetical protein
VVSTLRIHVLFGQAVGTLVEVGEILREMVGNELLGHQSRPVYELDGFGGHGARSDETC